MLQHSWYSKVGFQGPIVFQVVGPPIVPDFLSTWNCLFGDKNHNLKNKFCF